MLVNPISFRLSVSFFWKCTWSLYKYDNYKFLFYSDIVFLNYFLFFFYKFLKSKKTDYYISHLRLYRIKKNLIINLFYYNPSAETIFKDLKHRFCIKKRKIKKKKQLKKNQISWHNIWLSHNRWVLRTSTQIQKRKFFKKLKSRRTSSRKRYVKFIWKKIKSNWNVFTLKQKTTQSWLKAFKFNNLQEYYKLNLDKLKDKWNKKFKRRYSVLDYRIIISKIIYKRLTKRRLKIMRMHEDLFYKDNVVKQPGLSAPIIHYTLINGKYNKLTKRQVKKYYKKKQERRLRIKKFIRALKRKEWREQGKPKKKKNKKYKYKTIKKLQKLKKIPFSFVKLKIKKKKLRKKFILLKLIRWKAFLKNKKLKYNFLIYKNIKNIKKIKNIKNTKNIKFLKKLKKRKKEYKIFKQIIKKILKKKKRNKKKIKIKKNIKNKEFIIKKIKKLYNEKIKKYYTKKIKKFYNKNNLIFLLRISYYKLIFNYRYLLYNLYIYVLSKILKKELKTIFFKKYKNFKINLYMLSIGQINAKIVAKYLKTRLEKNYSIWKTINPVIMDLSKRAVLKQIKGFKFLITGRFKRASRATYLWRQRGGFGIGTITAAIDYSVLLLKTKYGVCAIKVWIRGGRKFRYFKKEFPLFKIFFFQEKKKYFILKKNEIFFNYLLKKFYLAYSKFNIKYFKNILLNIIYKYLYINIFLKKILLKKKLVIKKKKILKKNIKKIILKKKKKWKWKKNIKYFLLPQYCLYKIFIKDFIKFNYLKIKPYINLKLLKRLNIRRSYKLKAITNKIKPYLNIKYNIKLK